MADFASIADINPSTSINTSTFGLSRKDRKRVSHRMKRRARQVRRQARDTPSPSCALAVCSPHDHHGACHCHR